MVDRARITIKAGNGGDGVVHFRRARFIPKGGPDGGDGGKGGDVYIATDTNLATLDHFAYKQRFEAKFGRPGGDSRSTGASGDELHLFVPVGTIVRLTKVEKLASPSRQGGIPLREYREGEAVKIIDFDRSGMVERVARGGKGGKGNWHFKSSTNTTPREATPGVPGEEFEVEMDLKLLADVGLIGLPNVGKSTLLSVLSKARPKIADYPFTTLEPNLGVSQLTSEKAVVIADIPGLIEGASEGKGLGSRFLQHIERTAALVHVLAMTADEVDFGTEAIAARIVNDYKTIRNELVNFGAGITEKKEIVVLNKVDLFPEEVVNEVLAKLKKAGLPVVPISAGSSQGIEALKKKIVGVVSR